jgi:hypothetical protein
MDSDLKAWLGPTVDDLTPEQLEQVAAAARDIAERYPEPDDQDKREAALSATVQYLLGETDATEVRRELDAARSRRRTAYTAAVQVAVLMVRAGGEKKGSAQACGIDRMTLLEALGER